MSQHQAKFTWGTGPSSVFVAGNFNSWSDNATPLQKQEDGSFASDISLPWGEKQAFKYVVDGEWKVREDEAKEWDAAGNMNNVYTAPHAPASDSSAHAPVAAASNSPAVPVDGAASTEKEAASPVTSNTDKDIPAETAAPVAAAAPAVAVAAVDPAVPADTPAPVKAEPTEPSSLIASGAPAPASSGNPYNLGPAVGGGSSPVPATGVTTTKAVPLPVAAGAEPVKATAAVPIEAAPTVAEPTPVQIGKTAANANIGAAPAQTDDEKTIQETVAQYGAGAFAAIGAAAGGALAAVEKATGVDLTHGNPLTVEEAKAKGIDINSLEKVDKETDALSPVGTKPPLSAVEALEEKTQELKIDSASADRTVHAPTNVAAVPLPNGDAPKTSYANMPEPTGKNEEAFKHDIPAQDETDNHKQVPATIITPVTAKDPRKDRSLDAPTDRDTAGTKPVDSNPAVDLKEAKRDAEAHPGGKSSTPAAEQGKTASAPVAPVEGGAISPDAGAGTARPDATANNLDVDAPPAPLKDGEPSTDFSKPAPAAPATPAKSAAAGPGSVNSTPASTPAKSGHGKEGTAGTTGTANSDVRKRKSSFFTKIKHAFSPKDKEKK